MAVGEGERKRERLTEGWLKGGETEDGGGKKKAKGKREERRRKEGTWRIVCLWRDVQLVEDYYLSKRRREKSEGARKRAKKRGRKRGKEREARARRRGGADITSSIMVQLLLCTTYSR